MSRAASSSRLGRWARPLTAEDRLPAALGGLLSLSVYVYALLLVAG